MNLFARLSVISVVSVGLIAGIIAAKSIEIISDQFYLFLSATFFVIFASLFRSSRQLFLPAVFLGSLFIGFLRLSQADRVFPDPTDFSTTTYYEAQVVDSSVVKNKQKLTVSLKDLPQIRGKVLITTDLYPTYQYGDILSLRGALREPPEFEDFSYKDYLASKGIVAIIQNAEIKKVGEGGSRFPSIILETRHRMLAVSDRIFPEPQSSLLTGMLIGVQRELPEDFETALRRTGLLHIVVVSGYNMTLVILFFSSIFSFLKRRVAIGASIIAILFYVLLVGLSPPVLRAALLAWLTLLGRAVGRQREIIEMLVIAGAIMAFLNPLSIFTVSFQLSFAASLGLLVMGVPLRNITLGFLQEVPFVGLAVAKGISDAFATTFSASVFVFPFLVHNFEAFSWVFLPANMLVVILLEPTLFFGGLALGLVSVLPRLAALFAAIAGIPMNAFIFTAELLSRPSWAYSSVATPGIFFWFLYYILMIAISLWLSGFRKRTLRR